MIRVTTTWIGSAQGTPYTSIQYLSGQGQAGADLAVARVGTFWGAVDNFVHTSATWSTGSEVEEVNPATGQVTDVWSVTAQSGAGGAVGDPLPWQTQGLVRWRTGAFILGRELRGRTFIPVPTEGHNGPNGTPVSVWLSGVQTAADAYVTAPVGEEPVIYSVTHRQQVTVKSANAWTQWATLRSRRD